MALLAIPVVLLGFIIVVPSVIIALLGLYLVRRRASHAVLRGDNDVAAAIYGIIGTVYVVLLAFLVIVVWEQFGTAESKVHEEATRISNLLRDAEAFPEPVRRQLQERLVNYTKAVVAHEWDTMSRGKSSPVAADAYEQVWQAYYAFQPETNREVAFYSESVTRLNEAGQSRRERILSSQAEVPLILWVLLIGGGVLTVGCSYLFEAKNPWIQAIVVASLTGILSFILFLLLAFDHPFTGEMSVKPTAFEGIIELWEPRIQK